MIRLDPSKTGLIRKKMEQDITGRLRRLRARINKYDFDAGKVIGNSDAARLKRFEKWMAKEIDIATGSPDIWKQYIDQTYTKGTKGMYSAATRREAIAKSLASPDQFVRASLLRPVTVSKLKMLASLTYTDLTGVTSAMSSQMSRIMVEGLARGDNPRVIARTMAKRVDKIGITRARMVARHNIIKTHAEAQLDTLESLGKTEVSVLAEWNAASDACPLCQPLNGVVMTIKEARGLIPRHVNCRCAFSPVVGTKARDQKRTASKRRKAFSESVRAEGKSSPSTLAARGGREPWKGTRLTRTRRSL